MFDVSLSEIAVVGAVALFAVGPKELPQVLRGIGRAMRGVRRLADDFRNSIEEAAEASELGELRREIQHAKTKVIYDDEGRPYEAYDVEDALSHGRTAAPAAADSSPQTGQPPLDGPGKSV